MSNHWITSKVSTVRMFVTSRSVLAIANRVLSSAKLQSSDSRGNNNKSFRNILKSKGPKIEPCGTPSLTPRYELKILPILTLCVRIVR